MLESKKIEYEYVDSSLALNTALNELDNCKIFYIDTEFVSNRSSNILCLIQISNGKKIFLIDTIKLRSTLEFSSIMSAEDTKWILHSGSQDIYHLVKYFNITTLPKIFDTQVAWGAMGSEYYISLSYLINQLLDIQIEKNYQQINWTQRPLENSHLEYAASDVEFLPDLYLILQDKLKEQNKYNLFQEIMSEIALDWFNKIDQPKILILDSFRNAWELKYINLAALKFLIEWYNGLTLDKQKIVPKPNVLFSMAKALPQSADDLKNMQGIPYKFIKEEGDKITGRMMMATYNADSNDFKRIKPKPYRSFDEIKMNALIKMIFSEIACALSIAPEILYNDSIIKEMIQEAINNNNNVLSSTKVFKGWREKHIKECFYEYYNNYNSKSSISTVSSGA